MTHTPTPWEAKKFGIIVGGPDMATSITETYESKWDNTLKEAEQRGEDATAEHCRVMMLEARANAQFIVRAVNCHEELKAACTQVLKWWMETPGFENGNDEMPSEIFDGLRLVIAKAEL